MTKKRTYETESLRLASVIDIAIDAFQNYIPLNFTEEHQLHMINTYKGWKESCLNPEPKYKNLTSLKYDIENVFTFFQEGTGPTVEYFWKRIEDEKLGYSRVNKLHKIIKRGKLKGRIEYEYVIDMLVPALQNGMITDEESIVLKNMIGVYEKK